MAISTFKYATSTDLQRVFSKIGDYDTKTSVYNFVTTGVSNFYKAYNTGKIDQLYFDGIEGTAVTDDPNANYEYRYSYRILYVVYCYKYCNDNHFLSND